MTSVICSSGRVPTDLDHDLDGVPRVAQQAVRLPVLVEAVDAVRDEPIQPSRPLSVGDREITHTLLEVRATGIDRAHRHLVAEYEREVDRVGRNLGGAIASSDTGQHEDAVFAQDLHGLEDE